MTTPTFKPAQATFKPAPVAFRQAITAGLLSDDPTASNWAGHYMYMGTFYAIDEFKHRDTRDYIGHTPTTAPEPEPSRESPLNVCQHCQDPFNVGDQAVRVNHAGVNITPRWIHLRCVTPHTATL